MRLLSVLPQAVLLFSSLASAASWTFSDGTVSVQSKGAGVGGGLKEKLDPSKPLAGAVKLAGGDTLKVVLTTQQGKSAKRPHQAFLLLESPVSSLDVSYPFSVKESGKAKVELTQKDLPLNFLRNPAPLTARIVIASFGASAGHDSPAFTIDVEIDPSAPVVLPEKPLRYGKLPEIHHIFKPDPKSPNFVISLVFVYAVLATMAPLFGTWHYLGGNLKHLPKAFAAAPVAHTLFLGSVVGIEGVFMMYYTSWNLFQTLPVLTALGVTAFVSGSRALTEVQQRRLAGLR